MARRIAPRVKGHSLIVSWNGEYGEESSSTGLCTCGWEESASSQREVRFEYREHLASVVRRQTVTITGRVTVRHPNGGVREIVWANQADIALAIATLIREQKEPSL